MIAKAIIPAAGLGTRLLPATKEQPKEMLPILVRSKEGALCLKPFLQIVFEQLYDAGIREMCFIVGRGKRSIEDHFTIEESFMGYLQTKNKLESLRELGVFYEKVRKSTIAFVNQPQPLGFADSAYRGRFFSGNEDFVVHAGDDLILSNSDYVRRLVSTFKKFDADAVFFTQRLKDPRKYGVAIGRKVEDGICHVRRLVEKPEKTVSKLAVVAVYAFTPRIYQAIEQTEPGLNHEIQLTDAIQRLVTERDSVYAVELGAGERRIEIGDPKSYKEAFAAMIT